jgi:hypothetical protein
LWPPKAATRKTGGLFLRIRHATNITITMDRMSYLEGLIGPNMEAMERWRADIIVVELDDTLWEVAHSLDESEGSSPSLSRRE